MPRAGLTAAHVSIAPHSLSASQRLHTVTLPRIRVPHTFVTGLQLVAGVAQSTASVATVHGRHVPATHRGLPAMWPQSPSPMHAAHAFVPRSQRLALAVPQSVLASH